MDQRNEPENVNETYKKIKEVLVDGSKDKLRTILQTTKHKWMINEILEFMEQKRQYKSKEL